MYSCGVPKLLDACLCQRGVGDAASNTVITWLLLGGLGPVHGTQAIALSDMSVGVLREEENIRRKRERRKQNMRALPSSSFVPEPTLVTIVFSPLTEKAWAE
ncbi:hypothetical protein E2C01_026155 [Portunus trituberculatus]|uniref:Uncharacterized protein n=1 Tax=Portunus trituberculatus TaxID=210409 RepID=A0A5B7EJX8_PORTR|nr:hypothetical protein [Portunus trituberculatus]